jgi:hypothetical protein
MTNQLAPTTVIDPDRIPEYLCDGPFNISVLGPLATITFTHIRPEISQLFANTTFVPNAVVRARIVLNLQNLTALKDTLNAFIQTATASETPAPATGGATRH